MLATEADRLIGENLLVQISLLDPVKQCAVCGSVKLLIEYHRLSASPDGRQPRCKKCVSAYMRAYRERHAEEHRAKVKKWRAENPERAQKLDRAATRRRNARLKAARKATREALARLCEECGGPLGSRTMLARFCSTACQTRARHREWKRENPEKAAAARKRYVENNRDTMRRKDQRRRARRRAAFVEDVHGLVVLERADGACGICGEDVDPEDFHVDHIIPLALGGEHSYANTQPAHPRCNLLKRDRL